ncbi:MAG: class I tRNA ligase family protein [Candidatus Sungbacteria bacterium]|nr:class I tRNA ligase family protein [Candidatus Sungbacteria bacterium]
MPADKTKASLPELEEKILEFWEDNKIFEKSIQQRKNARRFVFYDGPPFATGLPHYGHILASTIKDVVPRYWTMRGFRVDRRWGWDCHGLPIETLVEQELNISGKKSIQKHGIKKFNETARSKVLSFAGEWYKTIRRIGRFVDFKNYYSTMDPAYMESVWWAFATLYRKGLVYKDSRTALFCPRCETQLSNFEIAMDNSYRELEDDSVYVKLPLKNSQNEYLLIWTTTPWTLPGNVAVAVNPKIEYTKFRVGKEYIWSATPPPHEAGVQVSVSEKISGKSLMGKRYEPLFFLSKDPQAYRVVGAEFVDTQEGTGLVHIAPAFGEEDFLIGKQEKLPILATLDDTGTFTGEYAPLKFLAGRKTAEANKLVISWLKENDRLWKVQKISHRYPICWRCQTPLIYKVEPAWFVKISAIKKKMLALNEKIDWHPEHLKHGRFGNGLETAPDWNISRSRFWGTPVPIWGCEKCDKIHVLGSRDEIHQRSAGAKNYYLIMRHGEAASNVKNIVSCAPDGRFDLTIRGRTGVERAAKKFRKSGIDLIFASDILRTRKTAAIAAKVLGVEKVIFDARLREINTGIFEGQHPREYHKYFSSRLEKFIKRPPEGETLSEVRSRVLRFLEDIEKKYSGKTILIVSHEYPLWMLWSGAAGLTNKESVALKESKPKEDFIRFAEIREMPYKILPRNDSGELDFHLPYIDEIKLFCGCGGELKRIPDVFDCWFESGSMPYAEKHYPFENKELFEKNFPADFIAEYIAQTRGWFYNLHVLSTALFGKPSFLHAVTTGTIMAESGEKMSKSRKNFPDPRLLFGKYGIDALRFYLMASPIMLADNINFSEKDVAEVYKKYSLISYNVLSFFKLYRDRLKRLKNKRKLSGHVLDRWIISRLHSTIKEITSGFDRYEIVEATRPLLGFVQDLSLWYVRRSRERVKAETSDALNALTTLQGVLLECAKIMAPVTPFLAEILYQDLLYKKKISVHLEGWPKFDAKKINKDLEKKMDEVRGLVSEALRLRAEAGIRVRQPLARLQIANRKLRRELIELIKDEINVKEVIFGSELKLDTVITPELKEEGMAREVMRNIQEMRKDLGLQPGHKVRVQFSGDQEIGTMLERWKKIIMRETGAHAFSIGGKKIFKIERELVLDGRTLWAGIF